MPQFTDPDIQAQYEAAVRNGTAPTFSTTDQAAAQAFVDFYNTLTNSNTVRLVTKTTYSFEVINTEG